MIDKRTKLKIMHDANSNFSDYSDKLADFTRDSEDFTLLSATDYLYIGFGKPLGALYFEFTTPNVNTNSLAAEYWNGTAWTSLELHDETLGFTRSGFVAWDKPADWESTTVNTHDNFYIRLKPDADHSVTTYRGINIIFSDDAMLKQEFFEIDNSQILPAGETSHIMTHVSVRNRIMQKLRNVGYHKYVDGDPSKPRKELLDQWDVLDVLEFRQAATYMALAKIFFSISDGPDDNWYQKYREYQIVGEEQFSFALASIDSNNDGIADNEEKLAFKQGRRLGY